MAGERIAGLERTPRRRDTRVLSVLLAVGGLLTLAIGPAFARNDLHAIGASSRHAAPAFALAHQALLDAEEVDEGVDGSADETDTPDVNVDEGAQGDNSQDESTDQNDQGTDQTDVNSGDQADVNDGEQADVNDTEVDEVDSSDDSGGDGGDSGGGDSGGGDSGGDSGGGD